MIIVRFGAVYNTAYVFPRAQEIDTLRYERPPIYARVSGLPGAFDYWGDTNFPFSAATLRKSFLVTGATYAAVQTAVDDLYKYTVAQSAESKLWLLKRDAQVRYVLAKCVGLKVADQKGQIYFIRAEVEFYVREGLRDVYA